MISVEVTRVYTAATAPLPGQFARYDASGGALAPVLPAAQYGLPAIAVRNVGASNNVTVTRAGTDTIEGATTYVLAPGTGVILVPDAGVWVGVAKF